MAVHGMGLLQKPCSKLCSKTTRKKFFNRSISQVQYALLQSKTEPSIIDYAGFGLFHLGCDNTRSRI